MKIAVLYYSNGGETRRALEAFVTGMRAQGVHGTLFPVENSNFSFPWSVKQFLGVFPDSVLGHAVPPSYVPNSLEHFDGVILAGQPWFLSLSPPFLGIIKVTLQSVSPHLPIFTLFTSRGMWISAFHQLANKFQEENRNWIGHASYSNGERFIKSIVATVRYILTGKRDLNRVGLRAGLQEKDFLTIQIHGELCAQEFLKQKDKIQSQSTSSAFVVQPNHTGNVRLSISNFLFLSNQTITASAEHLEDFAKWMYFQWARVLYPQKQRPWLFRVLMTLFVSQLIFCIVTIPLLRAAICFREVLLQIKFLFLPQPEVRFVPWRKQPRDPSEQDKAFTPIFKEEMS